MGGRRWLQLARLPRLDVAELQPRRNSSPTNNSTSTGAVADGDTWRQLSAGSLDFWGPLHCFHSSSDFKSGLSGLRDFLDAFRTKLWCMFVSLSGAPWNKREKQVWLEDSATLNLSPFNCSWLRWPGTCRCFTHLGMKFPFPLKWRFQVQ